MELSNTELEGLVWKVLSWTGNEVNPNGLEACHCLKKRYIKYVSKSMYSAVMVCFSNVENEKELKHFSTHGSSTML